MVVMSTLVQALRFCIGRTAHRGSRGIALPFHYHGTRRGWGVSVTPRPLFTPGKDPVIRSTGGWVGPRAGVGRCGKSRPPPPGFDPQTIQPVANHYNDWATRPTTCEELIFIIAQINAHIMSIKLYYNCSNVFGILRTIFGELIGCVR